MNDRFEQIALEAKDLAYSLVPINRDDPQKFNEMFGAKFAELIVRECIGQCQTQDADRIRQHFGIDE
jgi:hypothetical protein